MSADLASQARILAEALPKLSTWRGKTIVIKYGGAAMEDEALVQGVLRDVVALTVLGLKPVVAHGGGKAITAAMEQAGLKAQFVDGLRVSDGDSMALIERVLADEISPSIAQGIERWGGKAQVVHGTEIFSVVKMKYRELKTGKEADLGFVGEITSVDKKPLVEALAHSMVPVISCLGRDSQGQCYNINADVAAAHAAMALKADAILYLSDVNGIRRDPKREDSLIPSIRPKEIEELKSQGIIAGGMLPKVNSAVEALGRGVGTVRFLDGRIPHALLQEILGDTSIGTCILPNSLS